MHDPEATHLRVLIANEKRERLELLAQVVAGLGHEVIAREIYVKEVGAVTARERPDVALVGLGLHSEHALELIAEIVREASCPVIALLSAKDPAYVHEAAKRGVFAYIVDGSPEELQSAIDITLQRFAEYHNLQGAFGRRATIEQAKGILMARHAVTATERSRCCATTHNTTATSWSTSPRRSSTATSSCCHRSPRHRRGRWHLADPRPGTPRRRLGCGRPRYRGGMDQNDWDAGDGGAEVYKDGFLAPPQTERRVGQLERHAFVGLAEKDATRLRDLFRQERALSARRGALHARIDFIRSHGVSGDAVAAGQVEYLLGKERSLSDHRRSLHREIDRLQPAPSPPRLPEK